METRKPARKRDTEDRRREGIASPVEGFNERGRKAVEDRELHDAVELFTNKSVAARNEVLHALPNAPGLRDRAYHVKQETMANLGGYLERMADAVEAPGRQRIFRLRRGRCGPVRRGACAAAGGKDRHQVQEHGDRGDRAEPSLRGRLCGPGSRNSRDGPWRVDRPTLRRHALAHHRPHPSPEPPASKPRSSLRPPAKNSRRMSKPSRSSPANACGRSSWRRISVSPVRTSGSQRPGP